MDSTTPCKSSAIIYCSSCWTCMLEYMPWLSIIHWMMQTPCANKWFSLLWNILHSLELIQLSPWPHRLARVVLLLRSALSQLYQQLNTLLHYYDFINKTSILFLPTTFSPKHQHLLVSYLHNLVTIRVPPDIYIYITHTHQYSQYSREALTVVTYFHNSTWGEELCLAILSCNWLIHLQIMISKINCNTLCIHTLLKTLKNCYILPYLCYSAVRTTDML